MELSCRGRKRGEQEKYVNSASTPLILLFEQHKSNPVSSGETGVRINKERINTLGDWRD